MLARDRGRCQGTFGAARVALCLGLTLFLVVCGTAVFLSGAPGQPSLFHRMLGSLSVLFGGDDAGDTSENSVDHPAEGRARGGVKPARIEAGSGGLNGAGVVDVGVLSDETTVVTTFAPGLDELPERLAPMDGRGGRTRAGTLYDRGTGQTLTGARILATAYHGTDDPLNAGCPALYQEVVEVDADGSFSLPIFDPDDPRLRVHLQIDHPSYLPRTVVLERRDTVEPRWTQREVRLRRGLTTRVQLTDGRSPLVRVPVRVTPTRDGHALRETDDVWLAERLTTRGEPYIGYTDDAGYLRLPYSEYFYFLETLHPLYVLTHRDPKLRRATSGVILYHTLATGDDVLIAERLTPYTLTVLDQDGLPIADSEVEIEWTRSFRAITDRDDGRFLVGLGARTEIPPEPNAILTVLTPAYFKRGVRFKLPGRTAVIEIPSRSSRRIEFRTVTHPDESVDEEPTPIAPQGVRVGVEGLTLVRRAASGDVAFEGAVPPSGELMEIQVRGYLPLQATVPSYVRETTNVNMGDLVFARGLEKKIVVRGVDRALLEEATLVVSPQERPHHAQRYPMDGAATLTVGGLEYGTYTVGVEGRYLRAYSDAFEVTETDLEEAVLIPLEETPEEAVVVRGRVVGLQPIDMARLSVVESFFIEGVAEPIVQKSYPPAPDGSFGSVRRLTGVLAAHISVISLEDDAVDVRLDRADDSPVFDVGEVRLLRRPSAEISFVAPPFGRVDPPLHVSLTATDGLEAHTRFRSRHRRLFIDNLREGLYQLSWKVGEGGSETFGFEVRSRQTTKFQVARAPLAEEVIEVRLVDSAGRPVPNAVLVTEGQPNDEPGALGSVEGLQLEPGVKLARVKTRDRTRLHAFGGNFLSTRVEIDPGGVVPTELTLYNPGAAEARVVDADGIEVDGIVRVSWEPKVPSPISYGDSFEVEVRNGSFRGFLFPPLPMRFTFRLADSEASVTRVFSVPESGDPLDLGVLRFEETRALQGVVFLPDGSPAPGVTVALLEYDAAWRFPLRDPRDYDRVRYKARTDVQGRFTIEELPLDLSDELVLVAHKEGYGDAYEYPVDREIASRELQLDFAAGLELDVGYRDGVVREPFRFSLEYQADPADPQTRVDLGEISAQLFGVNTFSNIEPGVYRVKWGLRDAYDPIPPLYEEVLVQPGEITRLQLLLEGRELRGKASLNGGLVHTGWMLLSDASGISSGTRVGRITDGRFLIIDPPRAIDVYGAVIPESKPQALQNIARGEALPARILGYTAALRNGFLNFAYRAYDLKLKFSDRFLTRYPGAYLSFPHYEWRNGRFVSYKDREEITGPMIRFHLLPPGIHTFTVRSERGALLVTRPLALPLPPAGQTSNGLFISRQGEVLMK